MPKDPQQMEEELEDLEQEISDARRATDHHDHEPRYVDSGSIHPEMDDQEIAPPG